MAPPTVSYYRYLDDISNNPYSVTTSDSYIIGNDSSNPALFNSYKTWKVYLALKRDPITLENDTQIPLSDPLYSLVYKNGETLPDYYSDGLYIYLYILYAVFPCFLEGTTILCQVDGLETAVKVEDLRAGTLVKTCCDGYKKVEVIGKNEIPNPGNNDRIMDRLYKCSPTNYPELTSDLYITGCHSILVDSITDSQRSSIINQLGKIFVTDHKYRLIACVDERAEPWNSAGQYTIWHFALENDNIFKNYGVYVNGGLLVETCSINYLRNKSNMNLM